VCFLSSEEYNARYCQFRLSHQAKNAKELTFKTSQTLQQDLEIHTQIRSKVIFPRAVSFVILRLALSLMIILQVQVIV
jgi:hypothetical protein